MLIVSNWKAYVEDADVAKTLLDMGKKRASSKVQIILLPPVPFLSGLARGNKSPIAFGVQDIPLGQAGAHTGELTARMCVAAGARYALIGHSERRTQGETNAIVADKLSHALSAGLTPLLCVGETERDGQGVYLSGIREEITTSLLPLTPKERAMVLFAYEPIWAIGKTSSSAIEPHDLAEMVLYIRKVLGEFMPIKKASEATVLYGGSVEAENAASLIETSGANGFLVGHASADVRMFAELLKNLS